MAVQLCPICFDESASALLHPSKKEAAEHRIGPICYNVLIRGDNPTCPLCRAPLPRSWKNCAVWTGVIGAGIFIISVLGASIREFYR